MGMIQPNQGSNPPFSATLHTPLPQSQALPGLSQLYKDFSSLYTPMDRSITGLESISSIPQNFLYGNNSNIPLTTDYQYSYYGQNQERLMDLKSYAVKENMLIFGGAEASSSSDGSCSQTSHGKVVKQEEMGFVQGLVSTNRFEEYQKFILDYGNINGDNNGGPFLDQKPNGILGNSELQYDIEEVKQLISTSNGLLNDENKTQETGMYQYY